MVDNKIVKQVVSSLLNQNESTSKTKLYGTVVVSEGTKFVKIDGSDTLTAIVEGTDVIDGDRVIVSLEDHQAIVLANITSPASARTAKNYMDFSETDEGLVIGELLNDDNDFNVLIKADGVYIRDGSTVLASYTGSGVSIGSGLIKALFTASGIDFDMGTGTGAMAGTYNAHLGAGMLALYRNYLGYDNYDGMLRLQPGYIEMEGQSGDGFTITDDSMTLDGWYYSKIVGSSIGLGSCTTSAVYTSNGTVIRFTIPLPTVLNSTITRLSFNCTVRCGGHYLIQLFSSGGSYVLLDTSVTSTQVYTYDGSADVIKNVRLYVDGVTTLGINCRIQFTSADAINNGLNNHAAVVDLSSIYIHCTA